MIHFRCPCGQDLQVADELAERKVRCPQCKTVVKAPAASSVPEMEEEPTLTGAEDHTLKPQKPPAAPPGEAKQGERKAGRGSAT